MQHAKVFRTDEALAPVGRRPAFIGRRGAEGLMTVWTFGGVGAAGGAAEHQLAGLGVADHYGVVMLAGE